MVKEFLKDAESKLKEISETPVPLGKSILFAGGVFLVTLVVCGKPKTVIVNNYNPGGALF